MATLNDRNTAELARARLAAIVESSSDAIVSKTLDGIVTSWNRSAERIFGYSADEMIGQSIRRLIPEDRQQEEDMFLAQLRSGERISNFHTVRRRRDGSDVRIAVTISPVLNAAGEIVGASKIARDVTEQFETAERLEETEARFHLLADNMSQLAWMARPDGSIFWYNKRWYEFTGTALEDVQGWGWRAVHHPDHIDRVAEHFADSIRDGTPWEDLFPLRGADGEYSWFLSRAEPVRDADGNILRWFGTNTDVTEQKENEERIHTLLQEVNHRAKNLLAVVQAVARRTAASSPNDFLARFEARLCSLAASQDLVVEGGWSSLDLEALIHSQMSHLPGLDEAHVELSGPPISISAAAAQPLGMVIHELATNSVKYGALSHEGGRVTLAWQISGEALKLKWEESGGPPVREPESRGYGSTVILDLPRGMLRGSAETDYAATGIIWRASLPLETLRGPLGPAE